MELTQQSHANQLEVICDPIHQPNPMIHIPPCCDGDWDGCESLDWVDGWDRISLPLDQREVVELTPLEEDQSFIFIYFDHVLDLVQPSMMHIIYFLYSFT